MNPKPPAICPECGQRLAVHQCSGAGGFAPKGGCREPKILRLKNRAKQRQDPAYQAHSARLTRERLKLLAKPQQQINLTKERIKRLSPTPTGDGWGVFHGPVSSWLHDAVGADMVTEHGALEGLRQETEHHVSLSRKNKQAAIEAKRAWQTLKQQLNASTLTEEALAREISRQCRQGRLRGADTWVQWLVLKSPQPQSWEFYPWSVELTKLVEPNTGRAVVVQARLSLRPGISMKEAKGAAERAATRWLELKSEKGRAGLTDDEEDAIQTACKQIWDRDGKLNHGQKNDFIEKVRVELKRNGFSLNQTTIGNRCRKFFEEKGMPIKFVITAKREQRKRHSV